MTVPNVIVEAVDSYFRQDLGFLRKGATWYLKLEQMSWVVNLQKSQYSSKYFLNVGIWLNDLGHLEWPKEQECHVRTRINALLPLDEESLVSRLFDLEAASEESERRASLRDLLRRTLGVLIQNVRGSEDLRLSIGHSFVKRSIVRAAAQPLLHQPD